MKFPFHLYHHLWRKKIPQVKVLLHLCIIFIFMSEVALAADRGSEKKSFRLVNAISAKIPENKINIMKKDPRIKYIVNDSIFQASDEYSSSWGVQYIGSQPVHDQGINGSGVKIAVLDTGLDYNHEDLRNNYKGGFDFVNNDLDPRINSTIQGGYSFLSGTSMAAPHVAGVAALIFSTNFAYVNHDGSVNNKDVREIIGNSAVDAGNSGRDNVYGYGILRKDRQEH